MVTVTATEEPDKAWDRFVESHPLATVAHLAAWGRVVRAAYGHPALYLTARVGDEVVGVLPLVLIRSALFGRRLVSMPFLDYGGILADPGDEAERALLVAALGRARALGADSLGLRQYHPLGLGLAPAEGRVTMLLPLGAEAEAWQSLPSERRNRIRKGLRAGLRATWGGAELLEAFYRVFATNMRDLGSPVHGRRFFAALLAELGGAARVLVVRDAGGRAVGGAVCLFFRDTVMVPWVSSLREAFALCPNFVLYWEVIRRACAEGRQWLDFGRSFTHAGTFEFKRQWGAQARPLPWLFVDVRPGAAPATDRDPRRFAALARAWGRLPVPLATAIGPWLRKQLPN